MNKLERSVFNDAGEEKQEKSYFAHLDAQEAAQLIFQKILDDNEKINIARNLAMRFPRENEMTFVGKTFLEDEFGFISYNPGDPAINRVFQKELEQKFGLQISNEEKAGGIEQKMLRHLGYLVQQLIR